MATPHGVAVRSPAVTSRAATSKADRSGRGLGTSSATGGTPAAPPSVPPQATPAHARKPLHASSGSRHGDTVRRQEGGAEAGAGSKGAGSVDGVLRMVDSVTQPPSAGDTLASSVERSNEARFTNMVADAVEPLISPLRHAVRDLHLELLRQLQIQQVRSGVWRC